MPTPTYTALANITLGSSASSVTFSSIPGTYRDLVLVMDGTSSASNFAFLRFNSDSGSNYGFVYMYGDGGSAVSSSFANQTKGYIGNVYTSNLRNIIISQVMDYSASDKHKTFLSRSNSESALVIASASRWANTAAVTSMSVTMDSGTFSTGFTFALYGIAS